MPKCVIESVKDAFANYLDNKDKNVDSQSQDEKDQTEANPNMKDLYKKVDRLTHDVHNLSAIVTEMNLRVRYASNPSDPIDPIDGLEEEIRDPPTNPAYVSQVHLPNAPPYPETDLQFIKGRESRKKKKERVDSGVFHYDSSTDRLDRNKRKEKYLLAKEKELIDDPVFIDDNAIYEIIKRLKIRAPFELTEKISLSTFLDQFPVESFPHLSQQEYNSVVHFFVGAEIKNKLGEQGILPAKVTLKEYLGHLSNLKLGYNISDLDVLSELHTMKVKNMNLIQIFIAVSNLVDNVSLDIWPETIKCRHIFFFTKKEVGL